MSAIPSIAGHGLETVLKRTWNGPGTEVEFRGGRVQTANTHHPITSAKLRKDSHKCKGKVEKDILKGKLRKMKTYNSFIVW